MSNAKRGRFAKVTCPMGLTAVWSNSPETLEYSNLSEVDKQKILDVYKTGCFNQEVKAPLTEDGYQVIIDTVTNLSKLYSADVLESFKKLDNGQAVINPFVFVDNFLSGVKFSLNNIKENATGTAEEFAANNDEGIQYFKEKLLVAAETAGRISGSKNLIAGLKRIIYDKLDGNPTKRRYSDAANKMNEEILGYVNKILNSDPEEEDLKKVVALRYVIGLDEDGNEIEGHQSIFTATLKGIVWLVKWFVTVFEPVLSTDAKTNIFGWVGATIAKFVVGAVKAVGTGLRLALNILILGISFVVTAIIMVFMKIAEVAVKGWNFLRGKKVSEINDLDDIEVPEFDID